MYISSRKETNEELINLHNSLFNFNADPIKIRLFDKLCENTSKFIPSERCKDKKCVLGKSVGNLDSKIMFIAEAPGRNGAERTGIPLYGDPTGDNFENILYKATEGTITRKDIFITNSFLWNPTTNNNNDRPTEHELNITLPYLIHQIDIVDPELVIVLGMTAYKTLGKINHLPKTEESMRNLVGNVYSWHNRFLGVMYHPSPRVIGTHRTMNEMIDDLRNILKKYINARRSN